MAARFDIVVVGSLHLDIAVRAPRLPVTDETVTGQSWNFVCGGKGRNQAVMAACFGARTAMIGRVGDDEFGRRLVQSLDEATVVRSAVAVDPSAGSGMSVAIIDDNGEYGAAIVSGANLHNLPEDIGRRWEDLAGGRLLVLQNEMPEACNLAAARAARQSGAMIVHNAAPARDPDGPALDDLVDVLVVNRVEAGMFAGRPVDDAADAMAVLPALGAERRSVIVTLGAGGLVGSGPGEDAFALPGHDVDAVNSHGAGDCFIGALASRLAAGEPLEAACQFANAAAGLFVAADAAEREALDAASVDDFLGGLRP